MTQKTYRLEKWYPGLPVEWKLYDKIEIIKSKTKNDEDFYIPNTIYIIPFQKIHKDIVENNPDFWKLISGMSEDFIDELLKNYDRNIVIKLLSLVCLPGLNLGKQQIINLIADENALNDKFKLTSYDKVEEFRRLFNKVLTSKSESVVSDEILNNKEYMDFIEVLLLKNIFKK